jgi:hypothetical protein
MGCFAAGVAAGPAGFDRFADLDTGGDWVAGVGAGADDGAGVAALIGSSPLRIGPGAEGS